jgi:chromosome transmission fidelity protein 1
MAAGIGAGRDFYENQCMKAVNQCVGRAIRHKADYAAVVLMDQRYQRKQVVERLPKWISKRYQNPASFGLAYRALRQFFKTKEETNVN